MKKILILLITLCITVLTLSLLPVHGEAKIYESVIRLHVLANSNSDADQALKLCVRDAILSKNKDLLASCRSVSDAEEKLTASLGAIEDCAKAEIERLGYDYSVSVKLCRERYPQKTYASLCFPSGEYLSLQVMIGEAQGQNWWCVLFPPLCLEAASAREVNEDAFISVGLSPDQYQIIMQTDDPTYQARFKILEAIEEAFG